ncbi:glycosyltransferase [Rhizobacter sp. SG703]|uniref:glycosyltransferase n=1 Tax=Rhizobacter sp. SG703 TaxID=2587140 RepID=UPI0014483B77|nr:glycosyltransferase [Rhizobacter sp. SG703]NKI95072.1 rhamnosyltransferase [Rhizobacter sp. SG703]
MNPATALPMRSRLAVVVTTYKPDGQFFARFADTRASCGLFVIVDNTPGGHRFDPPGPTPDVRILQDGCNKGLGAALNLGIAAVREAGFEVVALFDQDSSPSEAFLRDMLQRLGEARDANAHAAVCIGPRHVDDSDPQAALAEPRLAPSLHPVSCLATSGMMFPVGSLQPDEFFTEEFFLDFVDFDWCWRLGRRGWRFLRAMDVVMPHRLGLAQRQLFGLRYHVPAPYRHYFQFRDTLRLSVRSYVPIYAKVRLTGLLPLKALAYPFLLDRGLERAGWMWRGVGDALRRVGGIGAAREKLSQ